MDTKTRQMPAAFTPVLLCGLTLNTVGVVFPVLGSWRLPMMLAGLILIVAALVLSVRARAKRLSGAGGSAAH